MERNATTDTSQASIRVNGRRHDIDAGLSVQALLDRLEITARYALVERNGEPVSHETYGETELSDGDEVVIARPVAGG